MKRVEYDLSRSDYFSEIDNLKFYFSSEFNKMRFDMNYYDYIGDETYKLQAKYHVYLNIDEYLLVAFYKKIEKRGFRVLYYKNDNLIELSNDYIFYE